VERPDMISPSLNVPITFSTVNSITESLYVALDSILVTDFSTIAVAPEVAPVIN